RRRGTRARRGPAAGQAGDGGGGVAARPAGGGRADRLVSAAARRGSPARRCAHAVLLRVARDGAIADAAFRAEAGRRGLEGRERAFAQRLAYGAIQRQATIDHVIAACASRPLERIDDRVLAALRLGVYQLLW